VPILADAETPIMPLPVPAKPFETASTDGPLTSLDRALQAVAAARRRLAAGAVPDLPALEAPVAEAIAALAAADLPAAPAAHRRIVALRDELGGLAEALAAEREAAAAELKGLAEQRRALAAYGGRG
jgi:DNA repair ATPase RecN